MTKEEIFEKLQKEVKIRGLSPGTYKTYMRAIDLFLNWANKPYEDLEEIDFRNYLLFLINRGDLDINTINMYIETFYQYIKNRGDFNDLKFQDYYDEQGFAFIMLVTGQIHQAMIKAQRKLDDNTTSIFDLLLKARALKLEKRGNYWQLKNTRKKDLEILEKVGFKPQERIQA